MNCTICGNPYVLGNQELHRNCMVIAEARRRREAEIDEMLEWWRSKKRDEEQVAAAEDAINDDTAY